jgi:hypothetical protein
MDSKYYLLTDINVTGRFVLDGILLLRKRLLHIPPFFLLQRNIWVVTKIQETA